MYVERIQRTLPRARARTRREDWIHWEGTMPARLTRGQRDRAVPGQARQTPSTSAARRTTSNARPSSSQYKYSYSANYLILRLPPAGGAATTPPTTQPGRDEPAMKITEIASPADKILLIDESNDTADDGCWAWQQQLRRAARTSCPTATTRSKEATANPQAGRGNATFADGHAEFVARRASFDPFHFDPKEEAVSGRESTSANENDAGTAAVPASLFFRRGDGREPDDAVRRRGRRRRRARAAARRSRSACPS